MLFYYLPMWFQDERQRIESLGGCVVWFGAWRVNGSLSVSRAIGDAEHKPYISGEPDVAEFTLEGGYCHLITKSGSFVRQCCRSTLARTGGGIAFTFNTFTPKNDQLQFSLSVSHQRYIS